MNTLHSTYEHANVQFQRMEGVLVCANDSERIAPNAAV